MRKYFVSYTCDRSGIRDFGQVVITSGPELTENLVLRLQDSLAANAYDVVILNIIPLDDE